MRIGAFVFGLVASAIMAAMAGMIVGFGFWRTTLFVVSVIVGVQLLYVGLLLLLTRPLPMGGFAAERRHPSGRPNARSSPRGGERIE